jgi:pimeloyl-ACP methyl ester carboxylesterase
LDEEEEECREENRRGVQRHGRQYTLAALMMTRLVWTCLAVELVAWIAAAAWLHVARGAPWPVLAACIPAAMLAARLALVCLTHFLAWVYRSPRAPGQKLGPLGVIRLVATEYRAMLLDNFWHLPFERLALRPDPPHSGRGRTPVVFLHGYLSNRGFWAPMVRWLEARGVERIYVPNYKAVFSNVDRGVEELRAEIERIAAGGAHRVVLVCHSLGGLIARQYIREHGEKRIARLVTIASPHHGTVLSRLGIGEHARQMEQGSEFLRGLEQAEAAKPPTMPALSIYSVHDNLVSPQDTSRLPWARNLAVTGVGHVGILNSEPVFALVYEELREAAATA